MNKIAVLISGGSIQEDFVLQQLESMNHPLLIGVDRGVEFLYRKDILPDYIVGDFDSLSPEIVEYYKTETTVPIRRFDPVKDASDTEIGIRLGIEMEVQEIYLFGATGSRIDHVWANIQALMIAHKAGIKAIILDRNNRIRLISGETHLKKEEQYGSFFSVFPLGESIEKFSIKGAKYPLHDHTLTPFDSLSVSNQIEAEQVIINFSTGTVILMETSDDK